MLIASFLIIFFRWDEIIATSTTTMRKLPLIFRSDWELKEKEISNLCRKFHTIVLDSITVNNSKLSKVISKVGTHARILEINQVLVAHESFGKILSSSKNLEKIIIKDGRIEKSAIKNINSTGLSSLKLFVLFNSDYNFFNYLIAFKTQVHELKIVDQKFLHAKATIFEDLMEKINYQFRLTKLSLDFNSHLLHASLVNAVIQFLNHNRDTLVELETKNFICQEILESIMKDLKIERLAVDSRRMPVRPLFYNAISSNRYLKKLKIDGELDNLEVSRGLFYMYPEVKKLIIRGWTDEIINDVLANIAISFKHLEYLEVPDLTEDFPEVLIETLKTFNVLFIDNIMQWQAFVLNNPSIVKLSVKYLKHNESFTYEIIDAVTRCLKNLEHVIFGMNCKLTTRTLKMMSRNAPKLRLVELFNEDPNEPLKNTSFGNLKVVYFSQETSTSVFQEEEILSSLSELYAEVPDSQSEDDLLNLTWGDDSSYGHASDDIEDDDGEYRELYED